MNPDTKEHEIINTSKSDKPESNIQQNVPNVPVESSEIEKRNNLKIKECVKSIANHIKAGMLNLEMSWKCST